MLIALALALAASMLGQPEPRTRAVVITTDCGASFDDQWAIAHLVLSPALEVKGIVPNHSPNLEPPAAETSARAVRRLLDPLELGAKAPPVVPGASGPLEDAATPRPNAGVELLRERARGHSSKDRLAVVILGAATDVASALLLDPSWADRVELIAMSFDRWPDGGDAWNVQHDPHAWRVLLASRAPIVVGDDAVCRRDLVLAPANARARFAGLGPAGRALVEGLDAFYARGRKTSKPSPPALPLWDEVATAHLLGLTRTTTHPRPALRDDLSFEPAGRSGSITWITAVDSERLWADLARRLKPR